MANSPGSDWLTVSQVANVLGTSTETVRRMIKAGELPASRAGTAPRSAWLIERPAFEERQTAHADLAAIRQRLAGMNAGVLPATQPHGSTISTIGGGPHDDYLRVVVLISPDLARDTNDAQLVDLVSNLAADQARAIVAHWRRDHEH